MLASDEDTIVGKQMTGFRKELFDKANAGNTLVSNPFRSQLLLKEERAISA